MKTKFAFFDFDDTLIHGDSGVKLLKYYIKKHPFSAVRLLKVVYHYALYMLKLEPLNRAKSAWLYPLDFMDDKQVEDFYRTCLEPCYYPQVVAELKKKKAEGYTIYICSASAEAYLRFCQLPVDVIMGTKTKIIHGRYTGKMIGKNCKNEEKVNRINAEIKNHNLEIDYDLSYAYSDSLHDVPMLSMVKNRIKIDTKDGHMSVFEIE